MRVEQNNTVITLVPDELEALRRILYVQLEQGDFRDDHFARELIERLGD